MLLYTGYFEQEETRPGENPPIGLILCTHKNEAAVRYTLGQRASRVFASTYKLHLPSEQLPMLQWFTFSVKRHARAAPAVRR